MQHSANSISIYRSFASQHFDGARWKMEALSHLAAQRLSKGENSVGWKALLMIKFMLREWRLLRKLSVIMNNCLGFSAVCQHHSCGSLTKVSALVFVILARIYEERNYLRDKAVSQTITCGREISVYDATTKREISTSWKGLTACQNDIIRLKKKELWKWPRVLDFRLPVTLSTSAAINLTQRRS